MGSIGGGVRVTGSSTHLLIPMKTYQSKGQIFVTFYSFTGGVGRTMALVNAACILAGRGRRILMMDFDLRRSGLTMRALKPLNSHIQTLSSGLVDLIHDCLI
jgi:Mrp family chromosome partitioning ATPase